jgi:hypothetical protein
MEVIVPTSVNSESHLTRARAVRNETKHNTSNSNPNMGTFVMNIDDNYYGEGDGKEKDIAGDIKFTN